MDYQYLYKKLNNRTPLVADCGILCNHACCEETDGEELGMYLFPQEEIMFQDKEYFKIADSELTYLEKQAKILFCTPYCNRKQRPLSCRIFPLFPYLSEDGELKVIIDPRGRGICPLLNLTLNDFHKGFIRGVKHIGMELMNEKETYAFLYELSRLIDDEIKYQFIL